MTKTGCVRHTFEPPTIHFFFATEANNADMIDTMATGVRKAKFLAVPPVGWVEQVEQPSSPIGMSSASFSSFRSSVGVGCCTSAGGPATVVMRRAVDRVTGGFSVPRSQDSTPASPNGAI